MTLIKTIRAKKSRINHQRMLQFYGDTIIDKHISFTSDSRYNFGASDFWISFFSLDYNGPNSGYLFQFYKSPQNLVLKRNLNQHFEFVASSAQTVGTQQYFQTGLSAIRHFVIRRSGEKVQLFVNGRKELEQSIGATDTFDFSGMALAIGNRINLTEAFNGCINNFIVANGPIIDDEIRMIHATGGVVPSALYSRILNHWPLTQRYYHVDYSNLRIYKSSGDTLTEDAEISTNTILGANENGTLSWRWKPTADADGYDNWHIGLSESNPDTQRSTIEFGWFARRHGILRCFILGNVQVGTDQAYVANTEYFFEIERSGDDIIFKLDGIIVYTDSSIGNAGKNLKLDSSFIQLNNVSEPVTDLRVNGNLIDLKELTREKISILPDTIYSWDCVEQYNYARIRRVDSFGSWTLGDVSFSQTSTSLSYDGTAGGLRTAYDEVTGGTLGDLIRVRFNVSTLSSGGKFWIFYGSNTAHEERVEINSTGVKEIWLRYTAGGNANIYVGNGNGFDPTDTTATWTVEDIEILPYHSLHSTLVNFTDLDIINSTKSIKDVYSKSSPFLLGIKFDDVSEITYTNDSFNVAIGESFSIEWIERGSDDTGSNGIWALTNSTLNNGIYPVRFSTGVLSILIVFSGTQATGFFFELPLDFTANSKQIIVTIDNTQTEIIDNNGGALGNTNPTSVVRLYLDGVEYSPSRIHAKSSNTTAATYFYTGSDAINCSPITFGNRAPSNSSTRTKHSIHSFIFYDKKLTTAEIIERSLNKLVYPDGLDGDIRDAYSFISKTPVSLKTGDAIASTIGMGINVYLRDSRGFPETIEGLTLDGSDEHLRDDAPAISYNANGTYTFMIAFKMLGTTFQAGTSIDVFTYYRSLDNANRFYIQGQSGGNRLQMVFPPNTVTFAFDLDIDRLNILFITMKEDNIELYDSAGNLLTSVNSTSINVPRFDLMQEVYYGRNALDAGVPRFSGTLIKYAIWSKELSKKEMITEGDNFLLDTIKITDSLEDLVIFNSALFSEDGTNVLLKNIFTGSNIKAIAFDGATTADQLSDLQTNHIVNINTLR